MSIDCPLYEHFQKDTFSLICSHLNAGDILSLACTSKFMRDRVISTENSRTSAAVRAFARELIRHLNMPSNSSQITSLKNISTMRTLQSPNLVSLRNALLRIRKQFVDVMKTLPSQTVAAIVRIHPPLFFENIALLTSVHQWLDEGEDLLHVFYLLIQCRDFTKLIELITSSDNEGDKMCSLRAMCLALPPLDDLEKTLAIARTLSDPAYKWSILHDICIAFIRHGEVERALEIAGTISDDFEKGLVLAFLYNNFQIPREALTKMVEIAHSFQDPDRKRNALEKIASAERKYPEAKSLCRVVKPPVRDC